MGSRNKYIGTLALLLCAGHAAASPRFHDSEFYSLERTSLEQLLDVRTSVASLTEMRLRETPGLVTVITREEIQASGARDLVDVLSLVPELDFGVDVLGNLGLAVRGNWANEGKVLLLWDGQIYNEPLYSTLQLDAFPVDQIAEIEIIKGPGSVLYGGNAELAVINIRTSSAGALRGGNFYGAYGQGNKARARTYAGYSYGKVTGRGAELAAKVFWGDAQRSDRRYRDFSGSSYGMNRNSHLRPRNLNLYASSGETRLTLILDGFSLRQRDHYDDILSTGPSRVGFPAFFAEATRSMSFDSGLRLQPYLRYSARKSWLEKDDYLYYDKTVRRVTAGLTAYYLRSVWDSFLAGAEYSHDSIGVGAASDDEYKYPGDKRGAAYENYAVFGEAALKGHIGNLTAGARYDAHSHCGATLVPRLAVTRVSGDFNFKAIYSLAFRAPSIENIRMNPGIKHEKVYSAELETGFQAADNISVSANLFRTDIRYPIVYGYTGSSDTYTNYDHTGTQGYGLTARFKDGPLRADLGYLHYSAHRNQVDTYAVPGRGSSLLGFPRHKLTFNSAVPLASGLTLNPSAVYLSRRYGLDSSGSARVFAEKLIANLNLRLKDRPLQGLAVSLGVRDIFNSGYSYIQPYDGGHAPLPAPSREFFLKGEYEF